MTDSDRIRNDRLRVTEQISGMCDVLEGLTADFSRLGDAIAELAPSAVGNTEVTAATQMLYTALVSMQAIKRALLHPQPHLWDRHEPNVPPGRRPRATLKRRHRDTEDAE